MRVPLGSITANLAAVLLAAPAALASDGQAEAPAEVSPPDRILLKNGDVLSGTIRSTTDGNVVLDHPQLGVVTIPAEKVVRFGSAEKVGIAMPVDQVAAEEKKKDEEAAAKAAKQAWQVFLSLAFAGAWNTDDELSVRAGFGARKETDSSRFNFNLEYYLRTLNSATTDNNLLLQALQEWFFQGAPWLLFAQGTYQYDQSESWEHRFSVYGGPGYKLIDSDTMRLTLRLGAGATYEIGTEDWSPQVLLAEDFNWQITKRQRLTVDSSIAPNVTDPVDFLLTVQAEYALAVDDTKKGLALTMGVRDIYDNRPAGDSSGNDLRVYAGLRYDF